MKEILVWFNESIGNSNNLIGRDSCVLRMTTESFLTLPLPYRLTGTGASLRLYNSVTGARMVPLQGGFMSPVNWRSCPVV